jgi:Glycosyl transferase family 11
MEKPKYITQSETDRLVSIFDSFKKDADDNKFLFDQDIENLENINQPILAMSSLGQFGRFGNQLFQYAFLRICAQKNGAKVECPAWIGQTLFGHEDAPISKVLIPVIESRENGESLFDVLPELIPYIEKISNTKSLQMNGREALETNLINVDLWGFFQINTQLLQPHKEFFCSLFQPVNDLKLSLEYGLDTLRSKGKTIIGVHIRRGDFVKLPLAGFTLTVPSKWYCEWLDSIWNELEEPILFLCSDELDLVVRDFEKFSPVTSKDLNVKLPERMKDLNIGFYTDFFMLSNCDVVATSNSIFSFTACMLNSRGQLFVRPHWDFSSRFTAFEPWNSEPLLWIGGNQSKFSKSFFDFLYVTYVTQGIWSVLQCIFLYIPQSHLKNLGIRAYLGYQIQGIVGVLKSFLYTFGLRSIWKFYNPRT